jgi:hypothetical protein
LFRHPRTANERRADFSNRATKEILESHGVALKLRQKRKSHMLPNTYVDLSIRYQRSWRHLPLRFTAWIINSTAWRLNSSPYLRAILLFFTVAFILL